MRTLANDAALFFEFVDKADDENLHVFLAQPVEELLLCVGTDAILSVRDDDQSATASVVIASLFILRDVLGCDVHGINHSRLPAFDVEGIERVEQVVFLRREIEHLLNLVARNKAN